METAIYVVVMMMIGLLILIPLWPTAKSGRTLLRRWLASEPNEEQIATAVRYLRRRRLGFVALLLVLATVAQPLLPQHEGYQDPGGLWLLLCCMLLAELADLRTTHGARREASLHSRALTDLVPGPGIALFGVLTAATLTVGALDLGYRATVLGFLCAHAANPSARTAEALLADTAAPGFTLCAAIGCAVAVGLIAWAATTRPARGDLDVDAALRRRSARVAFGLGVAVQAILFQVAGEPFDSPLTVLHDLLALLPGLVRYAHEPMFVLVRLVLVVGLVGWIALALPRRAGLRSRAAVG